MIVGLSLLTGMWTGAAEKVVEEKTKEPLPAWLLSDNFYTLDELFDLISKHQETCAAETIAAWQPLPWRALTKVWDIRIDPQRVLTRLQELGVPIDQRGRNGYTALLLAASGNNHHESARIAKCLVTARARIDLQELQEPYRNALAIALDSDYGSGVAAVLSECPGVMVGVPVTFHSGRSYDYLMRAIKGNLGWFHRAPVASNLIKAGAVVSADHVITALNGDFLLSEVRCCLLPACSVEELESLCVRVPKELCGWGGPKYRDKVLQAVQQEKRERLGLAIALAAR
jgi:hypothetical protein